MAGGSTVFNGWILKKIREQGFEGGTASCGNRFIFSVAETGACRTIQTEISAVAAFL